MGGENGDDATDWGTTDSSGSSRLIDPLQFSTFLFVVLLLFVFYLLLPRGVRKQYFYAHPKRHAWMARSGTSSSSRSVQARPNGIGLQSSMETGSVTGGSSMVGTAYTVGSETQHAMLQSPLDPPENPDIVISAAMQQLRDPGVLIVAHGSRGKPKTVRLSLTETSITWRTETRKVAANSKQPVLPKMGKLHSVPLAHIMYVDVGKQTTALRRVENASVPDVLCFSLLTKEGSLDLEAASPRERDALVSCFSLVLDEVHSAQNWRDIYRGPSSDMPSSFDEFDNNAPNSK